MPTTAVVAAADAVVGTALVAAGGFAWRLRPASRTGPIMVATGACWFAGSLVGAAVYLHRGPFVHLQLSYPTGRLRRAAAVVVVVAVYGTSLFAGPARNGWLSFALAALVAIAAADTFDHSSGPARKAGGLALASALTFACVLAGSGANRLLDWHADTAVLLTYDATIAATAVALAADLAWGSWSDAALADLVTGLGQQADTHGLRGQLQRALGDPSLVVGFWVPEQRDYVDDLGDPLDLSDRNGTSSVTYVKDLGQPLAVLVHDPAVLDDPVLVAGVAAAARLAVTNAGMRADVQVRVAELERSRRRLVETSDAQSRSLELELQRGAARRLAQVDQLLDQLQSRAPHSGSQQLRDLRSELASARRELGDFAQGIRPSALSSGGLAAALPLLAERASVPVTMTLDLGRLPPPVESAIYFCCSEALANVAKHARATRADVSLHAEGADLVATVADDGVGGADARGAGLRGLADRIEALGGALTVVSRHGGGTRLTATIPAGAHHHEDIR